MLALPTYKSYDEGFIWVIPLLPGSATSRLRSLASCLHRTSLHYRKDRRNLRFALPNQATPWCLFGKISSKISHQLLLLQDCIDSKFLQNQRSFVMKQAPLCESRTLLHKDSELVEYSKIEHSAAWPSHYLSVCRHSSETEDDSRSEPYASIQN